MERVVITAKVPHLDEALKQLDPGWDVWINPNDMPMDRQELLKQVRSASGLINVGQQIDEEVFEAGANLRVVSQYGAGLDTIDLVAARERNIVVTNLSEEVTVSTAELAFALMFACARRVLEGDEHVRSSNPFLRAPTLLMGQELRGKRLGIVGLGRIGQEVARIGSALGLELSYFNRSAKREFESNTAITRQGFEELLRGSDVISIHVPGGSETRHMIGSTQLSMMEPTSILINTARGTIVDESALVEALRSGTIGSAGLDVYENEPTVASGLQSLSNVVLTPHVGTSTPEARSKMTMGVVRKMRDALTG